MSFSPNKKVLKPRPPDKGSFPLDHDGECREAMVLFMDCMRRNEFDSHKCRSLSKAYLKCRMEKDLMAKEDLSKLGFPSQSGPD